MSLFCKERKVVNSLPTASTVTIYGLMIIFPFSSFSSFPALSAGAIKLPSGMPEDNS